MTTISAHGASDSRSGDADRRRARRLFIILLLLIAGLQVFLIAGGRLARGHQTRDLYEVQYSFLSACSGTGSVPLWIPFESHGVVSNRALFGQAGLLQSVMMLAGPLAAGAKFGPIFYLGLLAEELLLLVGVWRLARRLFPSPTTAFFVSVSALGSAFALDHQQLNVHSIAALPLLLSLLHEFLDDGSRRKLFFAGNLAAVQALGSPPGWGLAAPIAAALYFGGRAYVLREPIFGRLKEIGWRKRDALLILGILLAALPVALTACWGTGGLAGPEAGSRAPLRDLLVYAGLANPLRYLDFLLGATPSLDWSLYCGSMTAAFALVALLTGPRPAMIRLALALPAGMLALGTGLYLFFLCAPSLRPEPAPPFGTPVVRLFVIFLAGAGFQRLLEERLPGPLLRAGAWMLAGAILAACLSWCAAMHPDAFRQFPAAMVAGEPGSSTASPVLHPRPLPGSGGSSLASDLLATSALTAGLAGALLLAWGKSSRVAPLALTLILFLHPLDAFSWKFRMSWLETFPATSAQKGLQELVPWTFPVRRVEGREAAPRFIAFHEIDPRRENPLYAPRRAGPGPGMAYWNADPVEDPGEAREWMEPWSRLVQALGVRRASDWKRPTPAKLCGLSRDKIQFFSAAHPLPDADAARRIGHPEFRGDLLWIEGASEDGVPPLTADERLAPAYRILSFGPGSLGVEVEMPSSGGWILVADVWAAAWQATVNGEVRGIRRANLAYKAVRLDAGANRVEFRYRDPVRTLAFLLAGLNALLWLAWTVGAAIRPAFPKGMPS